FAPIPKSDKRFASSVIMRALTRSFLGRPASGIVHHLFGSPCIALLSNPSRKEPNCRLFCNPQRIRRSTSAPSTVLLAGIDCYVGLLEIVSRRANRTMVRCGGI
uniref:Uncharacterized protein n=1 Tax=Cannabis sativa TaxID=3483 RepID=A0A803QSP2_CANSA